MGQVCESTDLTLLEFVKYYLKDLKSIDIIKQDDGTWANSGLETLGNDFPGCKNVGGTEQ